MHGPFDDDHYDQIEHELDEPDHGSIAQNDLWLNQHASGLVLDQDDAKHLYKTTVMFCFEMRSYILYCVTTMASRSTRSTLEITATLRPRSFCLRAI